MSWRVQLDPALLASYVTSGIHIAGRRLRGHRRFEGDALAICRAIVDACWTGEHLAASGGHFRQFWTRDLGFSAEAVVAMGHGGRVHASLAWALEAWSPSGHVTTTIFPGRHPRDVWTLGVDSLPMLLLALRAVRAEDLVLRHGSWLARDLAAYAATVLDPRTGLVRDDRHFSTHRDTVRVRSNAYANAMVVLLDDLLRQTAWFDSPVPSGARDRFLATFWRDDRFVDRPDTAETTGDAAVVPFVFGVAPPELLAPALAAVRAAGLVDPLPLRYATLRDPASEDPLQRRLVPDYQGTAIWTSLGAWYLELLGRVDAPAAAAVARTYAERVVADGTVWEVFDGRAATPAALRPYRGRAGLFISDEAMLWASVLARAIEATRDDAQATRTPDGAGGARGAGPSTGGVAPTGP